MTAEGAHQAAEEESDSGTTQPEWVPWRWSASTWAGISVVGLIAAFCGVIGVLGSGFVFDPNDHGTDFYASLARSQLQVLVVEIIICVLAGLSCVLAIVRSWVQRSSGVPVVVGAAGFVVAVILLFLALRFGIPALTQTRTWITRPPV